MFSKGRSAAFLALVACIIGQDAVAAFQNIVQNRYLIETSTNSPLLHPGGGGHHRRSFYDHRRKRDVPITVVKGYNASGVFVGSLVELLDREAVSALSEVDHVISVKPVRFYSAPKPMSTRILTDSNNPAVSDSFSTHVMTGVDKVHAQGITGKGIKIGIIDTGIDYTHPVLGGGFGPGFKVAGGYDLVGDLYDGTNMPVPDSDPLCQCAGHGTHVAGIIGADPKNKYNISGVAYDATLYAYRIFGCEGGVSEDVIIDALIRGSEEDLDILTLSLGGAGGFSESPTAVVASRIAKAGKVVTVAAGNDGELGPWYASDPATGRDVISVGSVDNIVKPLQNATVLVDGKEYTQISYYSLTPLTNITTPFEIYATSNDTSSPSDACEPLPENTPNLTNKVVIIRRGTCPLPVKCVHAAQFGAKLFLIYNNDQPPVAVSAGGFAGALIEKDAGVSLVENFAQGNDITISFEDRPVLLQNTDTGGLMSFFSSYGPTSEIDFVPSISAPGGNIVSTLPYNSFGLESGTSMATPFVAGSAALVLQARGKTRTIALAMRDILGSTASPIPSNLTDPGPPQTLIQAGAGLIQVDQAVNTKTLVCPGHLTLNDTAHFQPTQTFAVTNLGTEPVTYSLAHVPAGTTNTYGPDPGSDVLLPPLALTRDSATVAFSSTSLTVNPGQSGTIIATFTAPNIDAKGYPAYSGHIEIKSPSETLRVSYLGIVGSVNEKQLLDRSDAAPGAQFPLIKLPDGSVQKDLTKYTFDNGDYPTVEFRLHYGSPNVTIDLVTSGSTDSHPEVVGNLNSAEYNPRTIPEEYYEVIISKILGSEKAIPDGEYRVFLKALKIFGNPGNPQDWDTWLSPLIIKAPAPPTGRKARSPRSGLRRHRQGLAWHTVQD